MQFTSTIIVTLLAVSTSPVTTAQKFSNLRGGGKGGHRLQAEPVLAQVGETSNPPQKEESELSTTLDAQGGDGCSSSE